MFFLLGASGIVSSLLGTGAVVTVPSGIVSTLLGTGAVATAGIGAGEVFAVAGAMVSASVIAATTGAVVTEASDRRVPNSEPSENDGISTKSKAAIVGLSSTVGATASYFCCAATCAAVAPAPAFGSKVAAAAGSGFGVTLSAAVSAIPGLLGFTSGGIAKGSIAAWMMSSSAVANGGGVSAGGVVATMQSIGAVGLGTPAIIGICGVAAIVMGSGLAYWSSQKAIAAALATATRYWTSPVVLVGTGAVAGGIVGWIVCVLVDGKFLYRIFDAEKGRT